MLRAGTHQDAAIITNYVFPLIFLSTTFLPADLITAKQYGLEICTLPMALSKTITPMSLQGR
jgi:hypothetical protein